MAQSLKDLVVQNTRDIAELKAAVAKILAAPTAAALTMDQINAAAKSVLDRMAAIEAMMMVDGV